MINSEKDLETVEIPAPPAETTEPDERGGIAVQGFFKIIDPESQEVIIQGRA